MSAAGWQVSDSPTPDAGGWTVSDSPEHISAGSSQGSSGPQQTIEPPEARTFGNYAREALGGIGTGLKNTVTGAFQAVRHPIDTAVGMEGQMEQAGAAAQKEFRDTEGSDLPSRIVAAGLSGAEKLPIVGGPIAKAAGAGIASPESVGAASELSTYAAAPKLAEEAVKAAPTIRDAAMGDPKAAALRAMNVSPKSRFAQSNLRATEGARPYLKGAKDLQDVQARIPAAQNEVWGPYKQAVDALSDKKVHGPDGETTVGELEKTRKELSAMNRGLKTGDPAALKLAEQKGLSQADALAKEKAVQNALDPELQKAGIDPKAIRKTFGQIAQVGSRFQGRTTLTEPTTPSGLGRATNVSLTRPATIVKEGVGAVKDIVAGRPLFGGKQTDFDVASAFRRAGPKPDLGTFKAPEESIAPENRHLPAPDNIPDAEYTMGGGRTVPQEPQTSPSVITPEPDAVKQLPAQAGPDSVPDIVQPTPGNPPPPLNEATARTRVQPAPPNPQPMPPGRTVVTPEGTAIPQRPQLPAPQKTAITAQSLEPGTAVKVNGRSGTFTGFNPKTGKAVIKWDK